MRSGAATPSDTRCSVPRTSSCSTRRLIVRARTSASARVISSSRSRFATAMRSVAMALACMALTKPMAAAALPMTSTIASTLRPVAGRSRTRSVTVCTTPSTAASRRARLIGISRAAITPTAESSSPTVLSLATGYVPSCGVASRKVMTSATSCTGRSPRSSTATATATRTSAITIRSGTVGSPHTRRPTSGRAVKTPRLTRRQAIAPRMLRYIR